MGKHLSSKTTQLAVAMIISCYSSLVFCYTPEELEDARNQAKTAVSHSGIGTIYGHIISFVSVPDIAASNLETGHGDDKETLNVFKIPFHYKLDTHGDWDLTFRGNFNYSSLKQNNAVEALPEGEQIKSEWETYSGSIGMLAEYPLAAGFSFAPAFDLGIARLENNATYNGETANAVWKPLLEGILLDWNTNATFVNAVLGLNYKYINQRYDLDIRSRYSHAYIDSFNESKDFTGFIENTDTVTINADFTHPMNMSLDEYPLSGVVHLDHTKIIGPNRDSIGFSSLSGIGYSIEADVSRKNWHVESLQLGAKYLTGNNVRGWSLIFGYRF